MSDQTVSDQTQEEPSSAASVFGAGLPRARQYVELLVGPGTVRGLIGPSEAERVWTRHLLNCAVAATAIPADARVVDIGSGAGLPGIPMALARPDLSIDLVETLHRRAAFLDEVIAELALGEQCRVTRGRAEDVSDLVGGADVVTARAVAPLAKLAAWSAPLLRAGGLFIALKGQSATDEVERDRAAVARAGIVDLRVEEISADGVDEATIVVIGRRDDTAERGETGDRGAGRSRAQVRAAGHGPGAGSRQGHGPDRAGSPGGSRRGGMRGK